MNRLFIIVSLALWMGSPVGAQVGSGPCAKDRGALCAGIDSGDGKIFKCLQDNKDKLSAECKAHQEKMKEHYKEIKEACSDDVEKFCGEIKPGKGRIMKCMRQHKEELSSACKAEMAQNKKVKKGK